MVLHSVSAAPLLPATWAYLHSTYSPLQLTSLGLFLVVFVTYWTLGLAFLLLDWARRPACLYRHKIQLDVGLDTAALPRLFRTLLVGQALVLLPLSLFLGWLSTSCGVGIVVREAPPAVGGAMWQIAAFVAWEEVAFYYSHRALHLPFLYRRIHKVHHEWKTPVALAASYAHPAELLVSNVLPLVAGPVLCRAHVLTCYVWFVVAIAGSQLHHCGYRLWFLHLPWDAQPMFHDYHHEAFSGNYGLLTVLDWVHGTDKAWRAAQKKQRMMMVEEGGAEEVGKGKGRRGSGAVGR